MIRAISNYKQNTYYPNYIQNKKLPSQNTSFMGYVYSPTRNFLSEINPIKYAADNCLSVR
jgi:hypothetical protein